VRLANQLITEQKWASAKEPLEKMRELYPNDGGPTSPYPLLAEVHRELKESGEERAVLEKLAELSPDHVEMFTRLTELTAQAGDWHASRKYALRWLAVSPLQAMPHRAAADAAEKMSDDALAIDCYRALLLLSPFDPAEIHLKLATVLERKSDLPAAKRQVLLALEETPRFREAHQRLLEIVRKLEQNGKQEAGVRPATTVAPPAEMP